MYYKPKTTSYTLDQAKQRIEGYCAYRERCHSEVVSKLEKMGMIPEAIDQIISDLIQSNHLNEQRFAIQFALGKFRIKHWGKRRIERELKFKGLSPFTIKKAIKALENEDYEGSFNSHFDKKLASLEAFKGHKLRTKLIRYFQYRGWENELIFNRIEQL